MSASVEFAIITIAAMCAISTVMTVAILAAPWDQLEWRLLAISAMSLLTSVLVLWIAVTTT